MPPLDVTTLVIGVPGIQGATGGVVGVTAPLALASAILSIPVATSSVDGYLDNADWTTFNSKQAGDATLTALAAYNTNGLLAQTAADTFAGRTITGTSNRLTVTNGDGVSGNPTLDISSSYVGQATITTLGTITTGVWTGTTIAIANGGTGQATATAAFDALSPLTTQGDLIYRNASNNVRLAAGTSGHFLQTLGGAANPQWAQVDHGNLAGLSDDDHPQYVLDAGDTMTGALVLPAGVVGTPTLRFGDSTSGFYRPTTNQVAVAISAAQVALWSSTGLGVTGTISCPGAGGSSERFGVSATAAGSGSTAVGNAAAATGNSSTVVGQGASSATASNTVFGASAAVSAGIQNCLFGNGASITAGNNSVIVGRGSSSGFGGVVVLGEGIAATAANQFIVSSVNAGFFGNGVTAASPSNFVLNATGGSGTDVAGASFTIAGGRGTGTGAGGSLIFRVATAAGGSSSTANSLATVVTIDSTSLITIANAANFAFNTSTGTKFGTATTQKIGFWNATPVAQPSAYTQTYSTADKTHANPTASALTLADGAGTNDNTIGAITGDASVIAAFQEVVDEVNKLIADMADAKQLLNSVIDDLQSIGILA